MSVPSKDASPGHLALELLNTIRAGGADRREVDLLATPADLERWLLSAGLVASAGVHPSEARTLLVEARRLRDDLGLLVDAFRQGRPVPETALFGLNRVLESSCLTARLEASAGGARLVEAERSTSPLAGLAPVPVSAARLIETVHPSRVRRCASRECLLWFVDTSKGGRRRWCSMARCGNRAKAARHRGKQATR